MAGDTLENDNPLLIGSLQKGIRVLEAFRNGQQMLGLTELADICAMTKSAAQRFTATWAELGYLQKDPRSRRYSLTHKALELGFLYLHSDPLISKALPCLMQVREHCGLTVNLSLLSGDDIVYVMRTPGSQQTVAEMLPGRRMPAWSTSAGRVLLAGLSDERIHASLDRVQLQRLTPKTELDREALLEHIARARAQGYAITCEQVLLGQIGVAAPIRNVHLQTVAAINVTTQLTHWPAERVVEELVPILMKATQSLILG